MLKLKTIGFIALEKIGEEIVVYSTEIFDTFEQAKDFIVKLKETETIKELLSMVEPIFLYKRLTEKYLYCKDKFKKSKTRAKIRRHFDSLPLNTKEFLEGFYKETKYFENNMVSIENLTISFKN